MSGLHTTMVIVLLTVWLSGLHTLGQGIGPTPHPHKRPDHPLPPAAAVVHNVCIFMDMGNGERVNLAKMTPFAFEEVERNPLDFLHSLIQRLSKSEFADPDYSESLSSSYLDESLGVYVDMNDGQDPRQVGTVTRALLQKVATNPERYIQLVSDQLGKEKPGKGDPPGLGAGPGDSCPGGQFLCCVRGPPSRNLCEGATSCRCVHCDAPFFGKCVFTDCDETCHSQGLIGCEIDVGCSYS